MNLDFTFKIVKWNKKTSKTMQIQLLFTKADQVSSKEALESLKIVWWGEKWFAGKKYNTPTKGGPTLEEGGTQIDANIPEFEIPAQRPLKEEISAAA